MIFISLPRDRNHYVVLGAKPPPVFSSLIFEYRVNHKGARCFRCGAKYFTACELGAILLQKAGFFSLE